MKTFTRRVDGWGKHNHTPIHVTPAAPDRPVDAPHPEMAQLPFDQVGPRFKGMDPSNPATYSRPWNPQPGMIAYLNFDGAAMQASTPTQLQRGPQSRRQPLKLNVGF
jgi:hypothetical protein